MRRGRAGWWAALAVAGVGACGVPAGHLGSGEAGASADATGVIPPARDGGAPASDGTEDRDGGWAVADAAYTRPETAAPPPAMCPTEVPLGRVPAGARAPVTARACAAPPPAAVRDIVVPDGARPAYRRCGVVGETATGIVLSPDGRKVAVLAGEGVHLIDVASWTETARIVHASDPIDAAAFSPDGARLATASKYLAQLAVWDTADASSLRVTPADPPTDTDGLAPGRGLAFSSDGKRVATPMGTIVDVDSGATVHLGNVRGGVNSDLWFLPGDGAVAARTMYHSGDSWVGVVLETFDARTGAQISGIGDQAALAADRRTMAGRGNQWNPNLVVAHLRPDGTATGGTVYPPGTYPAFAGLLAITNGGEALLVLEGTGIEAWSTDDPTKLLGRIELPPGQKLIAMSPADEVVTSGPCGTVAWDWRTGGAVWAQPFQVDRITWDSGGAIAAAIGPGALWRVWRTDTGEALCTARPAPAVTSRAFSLDGMMVQSYDDGTAELRDGDLSAGRPVVLPPEASGGILTALGRGGHALAVAGATGGRYAPVSQLVVVDTAGGAALGRFPVPYKPYAVSLSADGRRVAFANSAPVLYDVESGAPLLDAGAGTTLIGFDADDRRVAIVAPGPSPGTSVVRTYLTSDGSAAETFDVPAGVWVGPLAPDWSVAVGMRTPGAAETMVRWALPDGPVQPIPWARNIGGLRFSSDGQLVFQSGIYYHEFTGDYPELAIFDVASGSELVHVIDHELSPSADGRHLFGQAGAVFCR
jgi:hypothetical protein